MRILFLFLDGVGLGRDAPDTNPFARADLPTLHSLSGGQRWLQGMGTIHTERATLIPTDARLGVVGRPQSASGQAAIMTGINVPEVIETHYGPKPDARIRAIIRQHSFVKDITHRGLRACCLNAYPAGFFESVNSGKRLLSSNQLALQVAGVPLLGTEDLYNGRAMSADFTGEGWRTMLGYPDAPLMTPEEAGRHMVTLSRDYAFTFFDHWVTDYVGHRGTLDEAVKRVTVLDQVLAGVLAAWDDEEGIVIVTSDHGNMEDVAGRSHTENNVPTVLIGSERQHIAQHLTDLTGFARPIVDLLTGAR